MGKVAAGAQKCTLKIKRSVLVDISGEFKMTVKVYLR